MEVAREPRLIRQQVCELGNGRVVELLGYDAVVGVGEDGRATRWDSVVRDRSGRIVDSAAVSEALARAMIEAAQRRVGSGAG
ncbi:MAG: hypothetical protein QJR03_03045 [Sphaerobacter sp.]|nr:hypothetical protein [Sphaerobacter sp.]